MKSVVGQFLKNATTSWLGLVLGIVIAFFITPYLISTLGKERYGVWTLAFSLIGYMRLADVGMQQSLVRYVSKHLATEDWPGLSQVVSSSARLYLGVAAVTLVASSAMAFGFLHLLKIPVEFFRVGQITILVLGIRQALVFLSLPFCSLGPFHRFDIANYFSMGTQVVQTALIVVLLEMGYGLVAMSILLLGLAIVVTLWQYRVRRSMFPEVRFSRAAISGDKTKELLNYGLFSFLTLAAWTVILQTDNIIIAGFISTEAVALYSVPAMMVIQLRGAVKTIAVPLVPAISHLEALQDVDKIREIFARTTKYIYYVSGYFCVSVMFFGGPFILLWVGEDFRGMIDVLHILMFSVTFTLPLLLGNAVLLGVSRHKLAFALTGCEALAKIILSLALVRPLGLIGVALGTAIPQVIIYTMVYPMAFQRAIGGSLAAYYRRSASSLGLAVLLLLPVAFVTHKLLPPHDWPSLIVDCVVVTSVMIVGLLRFVLHPEDRARMLASVRRRSQS